MKKVIFIVLSVLLVIAGFTYMAFNSYNESKKTFTKSGYILDNKNTATGNKSTVYYFNDDTSYKSRYDSNVVFNDVNGEKVDVIEASFIHYNDDSVGVLKKSVIFNLEDINKEIPIYYNIFSDTILEYSNGAYYVDNLGNKLKFKKFIVKVNDTKYLIVSNNLKLNLDGSKDFTLNSKYVEVNFVDEKVVTIENKDAKYQTIGKDAYIDLGNDIKLSLDNRYIFVKDEAKLSIDQMIIDSSDNIEIQPIEEKKEEEAEETEEEENSETETGTGTGVEGDGTEEEEEGNDSIQNGTIVENEVVENELQLPTADISELEITANKIEGTIRITDKDSLITGGSTTTIVDNSTGRVVDIIESEEGTYNIEVTSSRLTPDTVYNLTTTLNYKKNDIVYTMDIVQTVFITSSLGISLEKDYYTSDSLNYDVKFDNYSKVKSCNVNLFNTKGELLETIPVEKANLSEVAVSFTGLKSNTKYLVLVDNILYDDYIVSNDYSIEVSAKTLRVRPVVGTPSFSLDKKNGKFTLRLDNMVDNESGVESYRYEIYDTRTMDGGKGDPITTIDKNNLSSIDINVDNTLLYRGVAYEFRVIIDFYDNEKYIEYITPFSDKMQLDGKEAPSISWKTNNVTFESIDGTISILDLGSTIDLEKPMTIVYTNSIGTTEQYTTAGNTIIPFTRNNLRANETYTISVYGTVNLQDGNPAIDNYHIGSVTVNTKPTNPFNTSFVVDTDDVSTTFKIKARLLNVGNADNRLEASTLTGITFILHEGTTANGKIVKTVRSVDRDLREYYSDLQVSYYDKEFVLNPVFFGLNNSDLTAEYYTIEIKDAYDYTSFKNQIGINNNIVTVKSNGYVPDVPTNTDDAITYETVRNKDADEIDSNLSATTIVGLKLKANYDNARRYARMVRYHVYDAYDCPVDENNKAICREITSAEYQIPSDGSIDFIYLPIDYGTNYDVKDDILRRGHKYYATYEAFLDLNNDGVAETRYPANEDIVLRSKDISISKEQPKIKMYPSKSSNTSITVKYTYSDVDKAIYDKQLHLVSNTNNPIESIVDSHYIEPTTSAKLLTFDNATQGLIGIYAKIQSYKQRDYVDNIVSGYSMKNYIKQNFYGQYVLPNLTYHLENDVNRLIITFDNYAQRVFDFNKIAAVNLHFTGIGSNGRQKTIDKEYALISNGSTIVDLFDLVEFIGQEIQLTVDAIYDTNLFGYDIVSDNYALQNIVNEFGGGEYYTIALNGSINYDLTVASKSVFSKAYQSDSYVFTSKLSNKQIIVPHNPDEGGMVFNYSHVIPKQLEVKRLQAADANSQSFNFNQVIPGVSLLDDLGESRIVPLMTNVTIGGSLYGFESGVVDIKDNLLYIDVFETDETGTDMIPVTEKTIDANSFDNNLTITGLYPDKLYAFKISAYINDGNGNYEKVQLYDVDENNPSKTYYFHTLSGVNFTGFYNTYNAKSYNVKILNFFYSMDRTMGFDKVRYNFYEKKLDELTGEYYYTEMTSLSVPDETGLQSNMNLRLDVSPGKTDFIFGNSYRLEVIPIVYVTIDGERTEVELDNNGGIYDFTLRSLKIPYIGVKGQYTSDYTSETNVITFVTNVYDNDRVVVGDSYTIQLLDDEGNDITPEQYVGYVASTRRYNVKYIAPDLEVGRTYRFVVKYTMDIKNNIESAVDKEYTYEINLLSFDEVNVGTITAAANSIYPNRIDLRFANSYRLTAIDTLNYSIYNSEDGSSFDGSIEFKPDQKTLGGQVIYIQTLPDSLVAPGLYYIQTQFLFNGRAVYDGGVDYTYVSSDDN